MKRIRRPGRTGLGSAARVAVAVATVLAAAACGDPSGTAPGGEPTGTPGGRSLSVPEALASTQTGPLRVHGYVVSSRGRSLLCEALAQSYPPQCGGRNLTLDGYDPATLTDAEEEQGVRWSRGWVELVVERRGDRFVVGP